MKTLDNYKIRYPHLSAREKKEEFDRATGSFMQLDSDIGADFSADLKYYAWKHGKYLNFFYENKNCFSGHIKGYDIVDYENWFGKELFGRDYKLIDAYEDIANGYIS